MGAEDQRESYREEPFSLMRRQQIDWLDIMQRQHTIHALLEFNITQARNSLKRHAAHSSERVSFTAFLVWCTARAVDSHKLLHACRRGRSKLIVFDDVDVTVLIERNIDGRRMPIPCIVRAANTKSALAIHREIRQAQTSERPSRTERGLAAWLCLPACLRRLFWKVLLRNPLWRKRAMGTVAVSAIGMFGRGPAWGIPLTAYTLSITAGGISRRPGFAGEASAVAANCSEQRVYMSLTLSMDHDIVDGAPAGRFAECLRKLVEAGISPGS